MSCSVRSTIFRVLTLLCFTLLTALARIGHGHGAHLANTGRRRGDTPVVAQMGIVARLPPMAQRLAADFLAASGAGIAVSPFIAVIDRSITVCAARGGSVQASVMSGLKEMTKPVKFLMNREVRWVWALYAGTYMAANLIGTLAEARGVDDSVPKLLGTTAVNMPACIAKDKAMASAFAASAMASKMRMPLRSYTLFAVRDLVSIAASFTLPDKVATTLKEKHPDLPSAVADTTSQLLAPSMLQLVTTPMHLVALDLFNNPIASAAERFGLLKALYWKSVPLRFGRVGIGFGIGGVVNKRMRDSLREARVPFLSES